MPQNEARVCLPYRGKSDQQARIAIRLSELGFNAERSYELVVSNKNEHKKHNNYDLMLESMAVKKSSCPCDAQHP